MVMGSVHKFDYGHKFAGASSASIVAGGVEAGDCCSLAGAGVIGVGGGAALRRECEPGFCVAQALPRRSRHSSSSATGAGDGNAGSGARARTGVDKRVDRDRVGRWLPGSRRQQGQGLGPAVGPGRAGTAMIPVPSGVRVWLAVGRTDMRKGMTGLALQVQEVLGRDPHAGDLYVFRGARGGLIKIIWHDGIGMSLYAKRLEHGRFVWPSPADGTLAISAAQLAYMLDGIDWRNPRHTWRPASAG